MVQTQRGLRDTWNIGFGVGPTTRGEEFAHKTRPREDQRGFDTSQGPDGGQSEYVVAKAQDEPIFMLPCDWTFCDELLETVRPDMPDETWPERSCFEALEERLRDGMMS